MDIKQLYYFKTIVENNYNITAASKIIHISQPALSKMIRNFEEKHRVNLFQRSSGRLQNLTYSGELLYGHAKEMVKKQNSFIEQLKSETNQLYGKIKLGIPPAIISVFFSDWLPNLIKKNPGIKIELLELGSAELSKKFIAEEVPIAVLLRPTRLDINKTDEILLSKDQLTAFMSKDNSLADKNSIRWSDLDHKPITTFNSNYMIYHLLVEKFKTEEVNPHILLKSSSWALQLNTTIESDLVTILPAPLKNYHDSPNLKQVYFDDPLSWEIVLCRKKKKYYTILEEYIFQSIVDYFH